MNECEKEGGSRRVKTSNYLILQKTRQTKNGEHLICVEHVLFTIIFIYLNYSTCFN